MDFTLFQNNNRLFIPVGLFLILTAIWFSGCKHDVYIDPDKPPTASNQCNADTVYFQNTILPLLVSNCATSGCHDKGTHKEGVILTDYSSVINSNIISLSDPTNSKLYKVLREGGEDRMPLSPSAPFTAEQQSLVLKWIEQGALNNQCIEGADSCDTTNVTFNKSVVPVFETNCYGCHSQPNPAYNIDLKNQDDLARIVEDGSLVGSVKHLAGYSPMPKGYNMSDCDIAKIVIWANDTTFSGGGGGGGGGNPDPCDPDTVYFQNSVLPLLVSNCATAGCHNQTSHKEGVILTDYVSIINTAKVKPGNPSGSKLYKVLFGGDMRDDDIMPPPPASPFNSDQKKIIYDWILQGALNNSCDGGCDSTSVTFSGTVWPLMQTWCTGCHTGTNASGGVHIENYDNLVVIANNGRLMGSVTHNPNYAAMPKNAEKLSDCQIASIRKWIDDGTPNN